MRKKVILPAALGISLIGGILFSAMSVGAQTPSEGTQTIIQRIAQRFNLNETDVQKVFEEQRDEHHAQMKKNLEEKLTQAVKDGKITEVQKTAILNKFSEIKTNKPDFKNMTPDQRKQAMDQKKTELENWAKENGLSLETLQEVLGHDGIGFLHKGMMFMQK